MNCVHRWMIDPPDGRESKGACWYCGETRMFRNWEPVTTAQLQRTLVIERSPRAGAEALLAEEVAR